MNLRHCARTLLLAAIALAGCGEPTLTIENPLAVINVAPHDGAVGIDRSVRPTVCFSEAVDASSAGEHLYLVEPDGQPVKGTTLEQVSDACIAIRADEPLAPETAYTVRVAKGLSSVAGSQFGADIASRFTTGR